MRNFFLVRDKYNLSKKSIIKKALKFYVLSQLGAFFILFLLYFVLRFWGIDINRLRERELSVGFYNTPISIVVFAPILEEIAFRLGLSFRRKDLILSLPILLFFLLSYLGDGFSAFLIEKIILSSILCIALYFSSQKFWTRYRQVLGKQTVIFMTILFALGHINNFDVQTNYLFIYPLLVLPQLVMGITFTYLRLNLHFVAAVLMHILVNSISVLVS